MKTQSLSSTSYSLHFYSFKMFIQKLFKFSPDVGRWMSESGWSPQMLGSKEGEGAISWSLAWLLQNCVPAKLLQSCPTLCVPIDCSPPGSSARVILQARIQEWVAMPSSRGSSWSRDRTHISCVAGGFFPREPVGKPCYRVDAPYIFFPHQNIGRSLWFFCLRAGTVTD